MMNEIPVVDGNGLSRKEFDHTYIRNKQPLIIKGLTGQWPAADKWSLGYFATNFSEVLGGCFKLKERVSELNSERGSRLEYLLLGESIKAIAQNDEKEGLAVATPIEVFDGGLTNDFEVPVLCSDKDFLRMRVFMSPMGAITTLHQDIFDNLYVVVKGAKKIMLYPPGSPVYANSRFSKLPNHAQVNPENPDEAQFPKFKKAKGYTVTLSEGESIYIPSLWWHHLRTESTTIALSFWWTEGWMTPIARLAAWYKKMRKI